MPVLVVGADRSRLEGREVEVRRHLALPHRRERRRHAVRRERHGVDLARGLGVEHLQRALERRALPAVEAVEGRQDAAERADRARVPVLEAGERPEGAKREGRGRSRSRPRAGPNRCSRFPDYLDLANGA